MDNVTAEKINTNDYLQLNITTGQIMEDERTPWLNKEKNVTIANAVNHETRKEPSRKFLVDIFAIFFGVGAWAGVTGVLLQLPLLVQELAEGWTLPSYVSICIQCANIGPICYWIFSKSIAKRHLDASIIYFLLGLGCIATLLMAFLHKFTIFIGDDERSLAFLVLCFITALVGCTSTVLFFPYIRHFKEIYLTTYMIGEGLGGFLTSVLALAQGVRSNPQCIVKEYPNGTISKTLVYSDAKFSSQYYFLFITVILALSLISFYFLNNSKYCDSERVADETPADCISSKKEVYINDDCKKTSKFRYVTLLILKAIVCGTCNGLLLSIESYSCLPYGSHIFHLSAVLSKMANPLACFMAVFFVRTSNHAIAFMFSLYAAFAAYIITAAALSPSPPLVGYISGDVTIILSWILVVALMSYIKLIISKIFRTFGGSAMLHCGAASQFGSVITSAIAFVLVNHAQVFQRVNPCP